MSSRNPNARVWSTLIILFFWREVSSLKNVRIQAPENVIAGESVRLLCEYDLENALLYSIKWYFNSNEFYSFVPKESPPTRVFPETGITVDMEKSGNKSVTMRSVQHQQTGYYECEISADAPLFHTAIEKVLIVVTEKPDAPPLLLTDKLKYSEGDVIKANCTSRRAFPAANLTWFVNNQKVNDRNVEIVKYPTQFVSADVEGLENSKSAMELLATSDVFSEGKLTLGCEATQFNVYRKRTELNLSEDVPQLAHVLSPARSRSYSDKSEDKIFHWLTLCSVVCTCYTKCR